DVNLRSVEDWDMWMRLAASGAKFVRTPDLAVAYRQHGQSMSQNYERMRSSAMSVLRKSETYPHQCAMCARARRTGRWGIRHAFLLHMTAQVAQQGWTRAA